MTKASPESTLVGQFVALGSLCLDEMVPLLPARASRVRARLFSRVFGPLLNVSWERPPPSPAQTVQGSPASRILELHAQGRPEAAARLEELEYRLHARQPHLVTLLCLLARDASASLADSAPAPASGEGAFRAFPDSVFDMAPDGEDESGGVGRGSRTDLWPAPALGLRGGSAGAGAGTMTSKAGAVDFDFEATPGTGGRGTGFFANQEPPLPVRGGVSLPKEAAQRGASVQAVPAGEERDHAGNLVAVAPPPDEAWVSGLFDVADRGAGSLAAPEPGWWEDGGCAPDRDRVRAQLDAAVRALPLPGTYDALYERALGDRALARSSVAPETLLVQNAFQCLLGSESKTFAWLHGERRFALRRQTRVTGASLDSVGALLSEFAEAGTCFARVREVAGLLRRSGLSVGLVVQAFASALGAHLHDYHGRVLALPASLGSAWAEVSLLSLWAAASPLAERIKLFASVCGCSADVANPPGAAGTPRWATEFPSGTGLLSELYALACAAEPRHAASLCDLLVRSAEPYLASAADWMYRGKLVLGDADFLVAAGSEQASDPSHDLWWTQGFLDRGDAFVPAFLVPTRAKLKACGQLVQVLKTGSAHHPVGSPSLVSPPLRLVTDPSELPAVLRELEAFQAKLRAADDAHSLGVRARMALALLASAEGGSSVASGSPAGTPRRAGSEATPGTTTAGTPTAGTPTPDRILRTTGLSPVKTYLASSAWSPSKAKDLRDRAKAREAAAKIRAETAEGAKRVLLEEQLAAMQGREHAKAELARLERERQRLEAAEQAREGEAVAEAKEDLLAEHAERIAQLNARLRRVQWQRDRHALDRERVLLLAAEAKLISEDLAYFLEVLPPMAQPARPGDYRDSVVPRRLQDEAARLRARQRGAGPRGIGWVYLSVRASDTEPEEVQVSLRALTREELDMLAAELTRAGAAVGPATVGEPAMRLERSLEPEPPQRAAGVAGADGRGAGLKRPERRASSAAAGLPTPGPSSAGSGSVRHQQARRLPPPSLTVADNGLEASTGPQGDGDEERVGITSSGSVASLVPERTLHTEGDVTPVVWYTSTGQAHDPRAASGQPPRGSARGSLGGAADPRFAQGHHLPEGATESRALAAVGALAEPGANPDLLAAGGQDSEGLVPLAVTMSLSLARAIEPHYQRLNASVVRLLLEEWQLFPRIAALRRYFLMDAGDMFDTFLSDLFSRVHDGRSLFNPHELTMALSAAVKSSSCSQDPFAATLSVAVRLPGDAAGAPSPDSAHPLLSAFDHLELHLDVPWPVSLVVTQASLGVYQRLFTFVLRQRRVAFELRNVWILFQQRSVKARAKDPRMHTLSLFRAEIVHFVETMQGYTLSQVLHVCWNDFVGHLDAPSLPGLDTVRAAHAKYLDSALHHCLLQPNAASLLSIINTVYEHILSFCQRVRVALSGAGAGGESLLEAYPDLLKSRYTFRQYTGFLFRVLQKLAQKGYEHHLVDLLVRLNFNDRFSVPGNASQSN